MPNIKQPCVAGQFYPSNPEILKNTINKFLAQAKPLAIETSKAIIAPHAGYVYSGSIAASIYSVISQQKENIRQVILLGPSHYVYFNGIATTQADFLLTPLGTISVNKPLLEQALSFPFVNYLEEAFMREHSLEVHLPFLQSCLTDFSIVPLVIGDAEPKLIADLLETLWGGQETLIVVSSDLSHFHDYETAKRMDLATSKSIENLKPLEINREQACGRLPIQGLLYATSNHNLHAEILDVRNSGDTAGAKDRVVGYGAYHIN